MITTKWGLGVSPLVLALTVASCGSTAPSPELVEARRTYDQVRYSNASQYAPARVLTAKQALDRAELAHEDEPGSFEERSLAYVAQRRARLAAAHADIERSRREYEAADQRHRQLQEQLRIQAQQQAEASRGNMGTMRQELAAQGQQLRDQQQQLDASRTELELRKAQLEKERRARELAEKNLAEIATVKQEARGMVITLEGEVLFPSGQSTLLPLARQRLDRVAEVLKEVDSGKTVLVEGHTDSRGSEQLNMRLSLDRANAVREHLISRGIDPSHLRSVGRGEKDPLVSNDSAEGRANNRRVVLVIQNSQQNESERGPERAPKAPERSPGP
jgi:outer membrane protein OmpA-like peptidoglycan-associated protein